MKKTILFSCIVMAALVACYKDDVVLKEDTKGKDPSQAKPYLSGDERGKMKHKITAERAMQIATQIPDVFDRDKSKGRSMPKQVMGVISILDNKRLKGRSAIGGADTLMHVVNYANNQGFAVISFDDRDGDILAYFEEGNFEIQDTVENSALKLHIDMMMAHQKSTRDKIQDAKTRGVEYLGELELLETSDEMKPSLTAAGSPGMPGLPGNSPNPNYPDRYWEGKDHVIDSALKRYPKEVFGTQNNPPYIHFVTGQGGFLGPDTPCSTAPYCNPPLQNYDQYYYYYGATYRVSKTVYDIGEYVAPLIKTYWSQHKPLNWNVPMCQIPFHVNCADNRYAGCAPITLGQMMVYHRWPTKFTCESHTHLLNSALWETKKTNDDLITSGFGDDVGKFIKQIGTALNVTYTCKGSGPMSLGTGTGGVRDVFIGFGYSIGYNGSWNYKNPDNFWRVRQSIVDKQPIFIYGFPEGWTGLPNYFDGHTWILDGYLYLNKTTKFYEHFLFDEYGNFCRVDRGKSVTHTREYIHTNMGRYGNAYERAWIMRGVYDRWGEVVGKTDPEDYSEKLYYIAGIKPNR